MHAALRFPTAAGVGAIVVLLRISTGHVFAGQESTLMESPAETAESPRNSDTEPTPLSEPPLEEAFDDEFPSEDVPPLEADDLFGPKKELTPLEMALAIACHAVLVLAGLAFHLTILWMLRGYLLALPESDRLMAPNMVWLAFIPCFNFVWNFIMYSRVSRSYQRFFHARGEFHVGQCGESLGIWFSVCIFAAVIGMVIPCVGICIGTPFGAAALILLGIYMVTLSDLKRRVLATRDDSFPATAELLD